MSETRSIYTGALGLLVLLLLIATVYGYWDVLSMLPQGAHLWRQSDCLAMVWNYKLYDLPFFQPATFNLQSAGGHVAGEFPLFYYLAARFPNPEFALRTMHTVLFVSGIFGVYFTAFHFLRTVFLALAAGVLLFTSPLLVFYGNNFLSDVPAWSFAMLGWVFFLPANKNKNTLLYLLAFSCFAFAALLKASHALNFVMAFLFQFNLQPSVFDLKKGLPYLFILFPASWYIYAKWYNAQHHDTYYFLAFFPAWKMSLYDIGLTGWRMLVSWSDNYFWRLTSGLLAAGLLFAWLKRKLDNAELRSLLGISLGSTALYILLFFERLKLHEYYYTFFFVFGAFAVIAALSLFRPFMDRTSFRLFLILFLALNIFCCRHTIRQKLQDQPYNTAMASTGFQQFLVEHGCTPDKTVLSANDPSVNQSLYWMKRKGYTRYNFRNETVVLSRRLPADIQYLVVSDPQQAGAYAEAFRADSLGSYQGISLYKLEAGFITPR